MKNPIRIQRKPPAQATSPSAHPSPPGGSDASAAQGATQGAAAAESVDLERRRAQLSAKVAELQWDLGGLVYEMAIRNRLRPEVIIERAAALQDADAELGEVERILRMERTGVAALCLKCGAPHSAGAVYCWQCGGSLLDQVPGKTIAGGPSAPA